MTGGALPLTVRMLSASKREGRKMSVNARGDLRNGGTPPFQVENRRNKRT